MSVSLSIVVPVYGTEAYLPRCLNSLLSQSLKNIEVIAVDDCSPDGSVGIVEDYMRRDPRVRLLRHPENCGLFRARVTGAAAATGKYLAFLDSDDYVSCDFYRVAVKKADETDADIIAGETYIASEKSTFIRPFHLEALATGILEGEAVRDHFFRQELTCFAWHMMCNKIYRKSLWDLCMPEYQKVNAHIIMTEDIAFSTLLFYNAKRYVNVERNGYFYFQHEAASTNTKGMSIERFCKNAADMTNAFDFAEQYLQHVEAKQDVREAIANGRRYYARMWRHFGDHHFQDEEKLTADSAMDLFCPGYREPLEHEDFFADRVKSPWNGGFEAIKREIMSDRYQVISFDVFDTLVERALEKPEDLFQLLNPVFDEVTESHHIVGFSELRIAGEALARRKAAEAGDAAPEDISLEEIYREIADTYHLSDFCAQRMCEAEKDMERWLCTARPAGRELYELALSMGKTVILISDMYLDENTVRSILHNNKYTGFKRLYLSSTFGLLKYTGNLFETALMDLCVDPAKMLHIGDNTRTDVDAPRKLGIAAMLLPNPRDAFNGETEGVKTNRLSQAGDLAMKSFGVTGAHGIAYGAMQQLVANRFFDNGYASFNPDTDWNASPSLVGYYAVGMHLLGVAHWLLEEAALRGHRDIYFLARDGYLLQQAVELLNRYEMKPIRTHEMQASRKCLMPAILATPQDLFAIPVVYRHHSPDTITELLGFCFQDGALSKLQEAAEKVGLPWQERFSTQEDLHRFLSHFLETGYDSEKHANALKVLGKYYEPLCTPDAAVFDMGYSGRLLSALGVACGKPVFAYYIHNDGNKCMQLQKRSGFGLSTFYSIPPAMSGMLREHLLSSLTPACIAIREQDGQPVPVFETTKPGYSTVFVVETIQRAALEMVRDYSERFGNGLPYSPQQVSMPFESFLRCALPADHRMFEESYFEDDVYGGCSKIGIYALARRQVDTLDPPAPKAPVIPPPPAPPRHPRVRKVADKTKMRLKDKPALYKMVRFGYKGVKKMYQFVRKEKAGS